MGDTGFNPVSPGGVVALFTDGEPDDILLWILLVEWCRRHGMRLEFILGERAPETCARMANDIRYIFRGRDIAVFLGPTSARGDGYAALPSPAGATPTWPGGAAHMFFCVAPVTQWTRPEWAARAPAAPAMFVYGGFNLGGLAPDVRDAFYAKYRYVREFAQFPVFGPDSELRSTGALLAEVLRRSEDRGAPAAYAWLRQNIAAWNAHMRVKLAGEPTHRVLRQIAADPWQVVPADMFLLAMVLMFPIEAGAPHFSAYACPQDKSPAEFRAGAENVLLALLECSHN